MKCWCRDLLNSARERLSATTASNGNSGSRSRSERKSSSSAGERADDQADAELERRFPVLTALCRLRQLVIESDGNVVPGSSNIVGVKGLEFSLGRQHDSGEAAQLLLDACREELKLLAEVVTEDAAPVPFSWLRD